MEILCFCSILSFPLKISASVDKDILEHSRHEQAPSYFSCLINISSLMNSQFLHCCSFNSHHGLCHRLDVVCAQKFQCCEPGSSTGRTEKCCKAYKEWKIVEFLSLIGIIHAEMFMEFLVWPLSYQIQGSHSKVKRSQSLHSPSLFAFPWDGIYSSSKEIYLDVIYLGPSFSEPGPCCLTLHHPKVWARFMFSFFINLSRFLF